MSIRKRKTHVSRGVACWLLGLALGSPASAWQDSAPAPAGEPPAELRKPTVLLLTNGHVFQGEIMEDATGYYLKHKIGVKQFTRRNVAGIFPSMADAYDFQAKRIPGNDPDEHMKLALWCIQNNLRPQAKTELQAVLELSENSRARAMLFQLESKAAGQLDPQVMVTSGTTPTDQMPGAEPRQLSQTVLEQLRSQKAPGGAPKILDLPAPLAVKRFQEFGRYLHPLLQNHCARCHDVENPNHAGGFRLVRTRTARDLQNDMVLRANLETTLELVNPDDLAQSKLLSTAAMTHPPDGRPVLGGPNHPAFRVFQTWVLSLQDPAGPNATAPRPPARPEPEMESGEGFASGRPGQATVKPDEALSPLDEIPKQTIAPAPRVRHQLTGSLSDSAPSVPGSTEFPDPRIPRTARKSAGGNRPTADQDVKQATTKPVPAKPGQPELVEMEDGRKGIRLPDGSVVPYVSSQDTPETQTKPAAKPDPKAPASTPSAKKPAIDTKVLDKYLQNRNKAK